MRFIGKAVAIVMVSAICELSDFQTMHAWLNSTLTDSFISTCFRTLTDSFQLEQQQMLYNKRMFK